MVLTEQFLTFIKARCTLAAEHAAISVILLMLLCGDWQNQGQFLQGTSYNELELSFFLEKERTFALFDLTDRLPLFAWDKRH